MPEIQENDTHGWIRESDSTVRDRRGRIEKNKNSSDIVMEQGNKRTLKENNEERN